MLMLSLEIHLITGEVARNLQLRYWIQRFCKIIILDDSIMEHFFSRPKAPCR